MSWRCLFLGHEWQLLWDQKDWDRAYLTPEEPVVFVERCDQCGRRRFIPPPYLKAYPIDMHRD